MTTPYSWIRGSVGTLLLIASLGVQAQLEDVSLDYPVLSSTFGSLFGCGLSTADFNGDGWDDVTASGSDGWIKLYTGGPSGFTPWDEWQMSNEGKAVLWIDIENDGDLDLFVGVLHLGVYLYVQQSDGTLVEEGLARGMPILQNWDVRGFSARDYDRDGDLDLYVASYHDLSQSVIYENKLFQNGGNGYFEDVTLVAGVGNGYQHSFQGAWMDFDGNGFDDLWVINDRSVFPNALYSNTGNGTFMDISMESGSNIGIEAMSATLFDADNDGDWDQYITNIEDNPNAFLRNNDGVYEDIAESAGVASLQYGWGTCVIDIDGDRWDDMMVATYRFPNTLPYDNHLYMNEGTGTTFVDQTEDWPNEQFQLYCIGRLDLDGDRVPDVVGHGNGSYDQVLHNTNSEGAARLTVDLVGTESNTRAVGSVIKVHADGLTQMRQVDAGCDYMTQHTYTRFFALGEVALIDSIEVFWPTGNREVLFDIPSDTALVIVEGVANAELEPIETPCPWFNASWSVPFDPETTQMTWNGVPVTSSTVVADSAGEWTLEAQWWGGGVTWSGTVFWLPEPEPEVNIEIVSPLCHDEPAAVSWTTAEGSTVHLLDSLWPSTVESLPLGPGVYGMSIEVQEGCFQSATFEVVSPDTITAQVDLSAPPCYGEVGTVEVQMGGGTPPLTLDFGNADPSSLSAGTWVYSVTDSVGCSLVDSIVVIEPDLLTSQATFSYSGISDSAAVMLVVEGGTPPYSVSWTGPIDADGWVLSPAGLGWFVQDANGCLDLGVLDVPSNPLASAPSLQVAAWRCERTADQFLFHGVGEGQLRVRILDVTGRILLDEQIVRNGDGIPSGLCGSCIVRGQDEFGGIHVWLK